MSAGRVPETFADLLERAEAAIGSSASVDLWRRSVARDDAEELLEIAAGAAALRRLAHRPSAPERRRFNRLLARRVAGEPMSFLRGHIDFRGLRIAVRSGVFAPRPSTELLAGEAVRRVRGRGRPVAVDVATGAGPVALAVAHEVPRADVWGVDLAAAAVRSARGNAAALGIRNVHFRAGDLLDPLPSRLRGAVDAVTFHPPYVGRGELRDLPREIRDFEPAMSLTDRSHDGLGLVRRLLDEAPEWLRPGGWVLVEIGPYLARRVGAELRARGFVDVRSHRDDPPVTRVVAGRLR